MMKKPLMAMALVCGITEAAWAQSSVTVFGLIDVSITHGRASGYGSSHTTQLSSNNLSYSHLGFRGTEDLGSGYSASFWLEAQLNPDAGGAGSATTADNRTSISASGLNFARRSTVSLVAPWGEVRLGRDVTPSQWNLPIFDPFWSVGAGASAMVMGVALSRTAFGDGARYGLQPPGGPYIRASNMIQYFTPNNLGGFYANLGYWLGEQPSGAAGRNDGDGGGARLGYRNGPFDAAVSWSRTKYAATPVVVGAPPGDSEFWSAGGQYQFSALTVMGQYSYDVRHSSPERVTGKGWLLGALVPVPGGLIRGAFSEYGIDGGAGVEPRIRVAAIGYLHFLSKRTTLYATLAHVRNSDGARYAIGGSTFGTGVGNGRSTATDLGIRHTF